MSVLPIDDFDDQPLLRIEMVGDPETVPEVCAEFQETVDRLEGRGRWTVGRIDRFAFYDEARSAFAVVMTGETAKYGNILLRKGVTPVAVP